MERKAQAVATPPSRVAGIHHHQQRAEKLTTCLQLGSQGDKADNIREDIDPEKLLDSEIGAADPNPR